MWSIRLVDYYPAPKNWRVSRFNGADVVDTKEGFFTREDAEALVAKLNT